MKRRHLLPLCLIVATAALAYDIVWINTTTGISIGVEPESDVSIRYADGYSSVEVVSSDQVAGTLSTSEIRDITVGETDGEFKVVFDGESATLEYPTYFTTKEADDLSINIDGAHVAINVGDNTSIKTLKLTATGTTDNGQLKVIGDIPVKITLDNACISNNTGSAINTQAGKTEIVLVGDNILSDAAEYVIPDGEKDKGTIYSKKALTISGDGSLTATGLYKQAICTDKKFTLEGGDITLNVTADDTKGIKADGDVTISGGSLNLIVSGAQSKGIKTESDFIMTGGSLESTLSGEAVVTDGDPSYCSAIKADGAVDISGGEITIQGTGKGNKGISCDSIATFTGGIISIELSGNGAVYTDANGNNDTYSSTCITADQTVYLYGGEFTLSNSGSAGKCIKSDQEIIFGQEDSEGPTVTAKTTGARIKESDAQGGGHGGGWGPGGGGWDDRADYSNPKVIKADGNLTVNSGTLDLSSTSEGGEGLESKDTLTINGGYIEISTVDDCINASKHIQINGGEMRFAASNNDAVDSNGTLNIAGGIIIAIGSSNPEGGFDCDNNRFTITGGTAIGLGGSTSTPTSSACTQRVVIYQANFVNGTTYTITNPDGDQVISFKAPKNINGKMVITTAGIQNNGTYSLYKAGTLEGGDIHWEMTTDAQYTPGTKIKTFTPTSMVTNI